MYCRRKKGWSACTPACPVAIPSIPLQMFYLEIQFWFVSTAKCTIYMTRQLKGSHAAKWTNYNQHLCPVQGDQSTRLRGGGWAGAFSGSAQTQSPPNIRRQSVAVAYLLLDLFTHTSVLEGEMITYGTWSPPNRTKCLGFIFFQNTDWKDILRFPPTLPCFNA